MKSRPTPPFTAIGVLKFRPASVETVVHRARGLKYRPCTAEEAESFLKAWGKSVKTGEPFEFEFRIRDIQVEAMPDPDQAERILVDVRYTIRATNSIHNLVFPFYLTGS